MNELFENPLKNTCDRIISEWFSNHQELSQSGLLITENHPECFVNHQELFQNHF